MNALRLAEEQQRQAEEQKRAQVEHEAQETALIPRYRGLHIVADIVYIVAILFFGWAVLAIVIGLVAWIDSRTRGSSAFGAYGVGFYAGQVIASALTGLLLLAIAQLIYAFRDIAMNTWKQLVLLQDMDRRQRGGTQQSSAKP